MNIKLLNQIIILYMLTYSCMLFYYFFVVLLAYNIFFHELDKNDSVVVHHKEIFLSRTRHAIKLV